MPSPAAAGDCRRRRSTPIPAGCTTTARALPALALVLVPALLMVSTIRFRSFKTIDSKTRRPYTVLLFIAAGIMAIATHPQWTLVVMAYSYLASAFIGMAITRFQHRGAPSAGDRRRRSRAPRRRHAATAHAPLQAYNPPHSMEAVMSRVHVAG